MKFYFGINKSLTDILVSFFELDKNSEAMKNIVVPIILVIHIQITSAQIQVPELSPEAIFTQRIGYTQFELRYGRPAARKRTIFGDLVPYGRLWRTGAGKCSTVSFDRPVVINQTIVPSGSYAVLAIPDKTQWTIMLNSDTSKLYGDPSEYDLRTEVVRFMVTPQETHRYYESLTMDIDVLQSDAVFYLSWATTQVSFVVKTGAHQEALKRIAAALDEHPLDPNILSDASYYYLMTNESSDQTLRWLDTALSHGGDRWAHQLKVETLIRLKRYQQAQIAATEAVRFLEQTKPVEYEVEIQNYLAKMQTWKKRRDR